MARRTADNSAEAPSRTAAKGISRAAQLRAAKRAQRARQRARDIVQVELQLPRRLAYRLRSARRAPRFEELLEEVLARAVVCLDDYPQLRDLAWNRHEPYLPAAEAFALYERNWRFVDIALMSAEERALLDRLTVEFGNGVINA